MTLPYLVRLACLCSACFFLLQLLFSGAVRLGAGGAIRFAEGMPPRQATRWLLLLRTLPFWAAAGLVAGVGVPSYLWLESPDSWEEVGALCLVAAGLALASVLLALRRVIRAVWKCRGLGQGAAPIVVDAAGPLLALAGLVRPRLFISRTLLEALPADQLAAALRHEEAHRASRDNWKRLLLLALPDLFPMLRVLDQAWSRAAEWAADDAAVAGDAERSVSLASALVTCARLGSVHPRSMPASLLLASSDGLAARVERLLAGSPPNPASGAVWRVLTLAPAALWLAWGVTLWLHPGALARVHQFLELLLSDFT